MTNTPSAVTADGPLIEFIRDYVNIDPDVRSRVTPLISVLVNGYVSGYAEGYRAASAAPTTTA